MQPIQPPQEVVRLLLSEDGAQQAQFYIDHYTPRQRREFKHSLNASMWDEISLLRTAIKQFYAASTKAQDPKLTLHLACELQSIGLACTRLAGIIKINEDLTATRATATDDLIIQALESVLDEMSADLNNQLPGSTK